MTHDHSDHQDHGHQNHDHQALSEMLDLDAEIFASAMRTVYADIENAADAPVRSILDLGAGTGAGTFGLLQHFTGARAVAVDSSADMLTGLEQEAERRGLTDRITTARADLDEALPVLDPVDLAWAAASLHHLSDPDRTLGQITSAIRPGGLLAVAEVNGLPRFLSSDTPGGAAELRAHELIAADRAVDMPMMGSDWGSRLTRAGLVVDVHRTITADLASPVPAAVNRYAAAVLTRIRRAVVDRLDPADLHAFDALLDEGPDDVRRRADLHVISSERLLWIARRPA
ncbi:class I SAM-dependent methyltransferase [Aeromicrobium sp. CF3.5]|uniref:class I SAM-dependent methyltransferase n=1 Tax=Aeromicrobium sp. CF3.5 TaxID=3373078 RepID=UPI003EE4BFCE